MRENPEVLKQYQDRFKYMLVDEYQDTNAIQYMWLRLLAQGRQNVCCVGDDDQSIYGWRGAEVDNILRFETDFPGAKVIRLERNYRSTGIFSPWRRASSRIMKGRLGKTLFTDDEAGHKPTVTGVWDSEEEARSVGEEIEQLARAGGAYDEIAILVRASFQMREFEERFITLGLPYRVIGGPRFYERAEIRDALAYLRCVAQPADDLAFERIFNTPRRGLGDATLQLLHDHSRRQRIPLMQAAQFMVETDELKPKQRQVLRGLLSDFARWAGLIDQKPQGELTEMILEESGYTDMWRKDRTAEAAGRLENLKELVRAMEEFPDLGAFLEHISLVMEAEGKDVGPRVSIMTLHGAKGLEFETVFLPGWEEGLFPHQRSLDENGRAGLEEERRLAYVGVTRARRRAKIYFATNRRIHGLWQTTIPSRFLDELPAGHVDVVEAATGAAYGGYAQSRFANMDSFGSSYSTPGWRRAQQRGEETRGAAKSGGFWRRGAARAAADRGRSRREIERRVGFCEGRAGVPSEIRLWRRGGGRRQQADGRFRQGRPQDGAGEFCAGGVGERSFGLIFQRGMTWHQHRFRNVLFAKRVQLWTSEARKSWKCRARDVESFLLWGTMLQAIHSDCYTLPRRSVLSYLLRQKQRGNSPIKVVETDPQFGGLDDTASFAGLSRLRN